MPILLITHREVKTCKIKKKLNLVENQQTTQEVQHLLKLTYKMNGFPQKLSELFRR